MIWTAQLQHRSVVAASSSIVRQGYDAARAGSEASAKLVTAWLVTVVGGKDEA
jgi:hypothetical protein